MSTDEKPSGQDQINGFIAIAVASITSAVVYFVIFAWIR